MDISKTNLNPELLEFLQEFLQEERKLTFENTLNQRTRHLTVVLENLYDVHNTNAVMRSCECFGIQDVHVISNEKKFKPAKNVLRGSHKWLTVHDYKGKTQNTFDCIHSLKSKGYRIVATSSHEQQRVLSDVDVSSPLAIFFGQENEGVSNTVNDNADEFVTIPMQGFTESFNISVAAGIIIYDLSKRIRENKNINWQLSEKEKYDLLCEWTLKSIYRPELLIDRFNVQSSMFNV